MASTVAECSRRPGVTASRPRRRPARHADADGASAAVRMSASSRLVNPPNESRWAGSVASSNRVARSSVSTAESPAGGTPAGNASSTTRLAAAK